MYVIEEAVKCKLKARIVIEGPAGAGKTMTSLITAGGLGAVRPLVVDTQRRQSLHFASRYPFSVLHMDRFHPREMIDVCAVAAGNGHDALIIDSGSSFWSGREGVLDQVDSSSNEPGGKFSNGWRNIKPFEQAMVDALLSYSGHVIMTLRVKSDWAIEANAQGRSAPKKLGTKPEQRDGLDYEFDFVFNMDVENNLTVTKSPCPDLQGSMWPKPDDTLGRRLATWLDDGEATVTAAEIRDKALLPDATVDELNELKGQARMLGLLGTALFDDDGEATTLWRLINRCGKAAQQREGIRP